METSVHLLDVIHVKSYFSLHFHCFGKPSIALCVFVQSPVLGTYLHKQFTKVRFGIWMLTWAALTLCFQLSNEEEILLWFHLFFNWSK